MDIVDSQAHLGPGGAAEMLAAMDALGIAAVLIDEWWMGKTLDPGYHLPNGAFRATAPTAELASWMYPGRFSYLMRVYPDDPDLESLIRQLRDATFCRALRIAPGINRDELKRFEAGHYDRLFATASDCGLPICVAIPGHADRLARYAARFPAARIIVDHIGLRPGPEMRPMAIRLEGLPDSEAYWTKLCEEPVGEALDRVLRLADHPNVALKWAHAPALFEMSGYPHLGIRPFLRRAINAFGADRVMWAGDAQANHSGESWAELLFTIRNDPGLSAAEKAAVLGGTARTWLDWPAQKPSP